MTKLARIARTTAIASCFLPLIACATSVDSSDDDSGSQNQYIVVVDPSCELGAERECWMSDGFGEVGSESCIEVDGERGWGECIAYADITCGPGYFSNGECCVDQNTGCCEGDDTCAPASGGSTPLVLAHEGQAVSYHQHMTGSFDLTGQAQSMATDWPTAATPWLAFDRDGDGVISHGGELFGSATTLADGSVAPNGFVALAELDSDGDGLITPADARFAALVVWADARHRVRPATRAPTARSSAPASVSSPSRACRSARSSTSTSRTADTRGLSIEAEAGAAVHALARVRADDAAALRAAGGAVARVVAGLERRTHRRQLFLAWDGRRRPHRGRRIVFVVAWQRRTRGAWDGAVSRQARLAGSWLWLDGAAWSLEVGAGRRRAMCAPCSRRE